MMKYPNNNNKCVLPLVANCIWRSSPKDTGVPTKDETVKTTWISSKLTNPGSIKSSALNIIFVWLIKGVYSCRESLISENRLEKFCRIVSEVSSFVYILYGSSHGRKINLKSNASPKPISFPFYNHFILCKTIFFGGYRYCFCAKNQICFNPSSLKPDGFNLKHFKLKLFDLNHTEIVVWNI